MIYLIGMASAGVGGGSKVLMVELGLSGGLGICSDKDGNVTISSSVLVGATALLEEVDSFDAED